MDVTRRLGLATLVALCLSTAATQAQTIHVIASGALTEALAEILPTFESATGHRVVAVYGPSTGTAPDAIALRLERGEPADVVITSTTSLADFAGRRRIVPDSRVDLVTSRIGAAVRAGAEKPNISSVDALTRALLAARSIAYSSSVSGVYLSTELFPRLGIADRLAPKLVRVSTGRVAEAVARGEAELGFQQVSELLPEPGVDFVGPLPDAVQKITVYAAAVDARSAARATAEALIRFLSSPSSAAVFAVRGLEPVATR